MTDFRIHGHIYRHLTNATTPATHKYNSMPSTTTENHQNHQNQMCDMSQYKLSHKNNQTYFPLQFKKCDLPHYMYKKQKAICGIIYQ